MTNEELNNPVWHALAGPQANWAEREGRAVCFVPDAAPFFAIDRAETQAYADLAGLLGSAAEARMFRPAAEATPAGWRKTFEKPILQMVLPTQAPLPPEMPGIDPPGLLKKSRAAPVRGAPRLCALGHNDLADMMGLARATKPGPFVPRTHELGAFIGIRQDGRLVAMAGERFRLSRHTEISAVAVDPTQRGRGHGRALTAALAAGIRVRGKIPMLHVFPDNAAALKLYQSIGFVTRAELTIVWLAPE